MSTLALEFPFLPPSENHIHTIGYPGGKAQIVYTREATKFSSDVIGHCRDTYLAAITAFVRTDTPVDVYEVSFVLGMPAERVLNKTWLARGSAKAKSPYKRVDGANTQGLLLDAISRILGIDDSRFFSHHGAKMVLPAGEKPQMLVEVVRKDGADFDVPLEYLETT